MYDNSTTDTQLHHNAQNKPMLSLRVIDHTFLIFRFKLHYLGPVFLNTSISTMTTIQSTVKRTGSGYFNDIVSITKVE